MKRFRTCSLNQPLLLPPSLQDWLPEEHLARFIAAVVDELDLSRLVSRYGRKDGRGKAAYHPAMLLRLVLYGYAIGVRSSRKIEKATYENVAFRYLAAGEHPDHDVIAEFRKTHLEELSRLFAATLQLCQKAGLVKLGQIAIDGTKVAANASRQESRSYERLSEKEKLLEEAKRLLQEAATADAKEDEEFGKGKRGDELPEELATAERQLAKIRAAKQELEREAREKAEQAEREKAEQEGKSRDEAQRKRWQRAKAGVPDAKSQGNLTDPESRLMMDGMSKTYVQGYNAQAAVTEGSHIIVGQTVTQEPNDRQQLTPMLQQVEQNVGSTPELTTADAGYWSEHVIVGLQAAGRNVLVPPDGGKMNGQQELPKTAPRGPAAQQMRERLKQEEQQKLYRKRNGTVEPVFGVIKEILGYRRFLLRGLKKVQGEWSLICTSFNLRKLFQYRVPQTS